MARIKGIVMENQNGQAVIMTPQGEFKRIKINKPIDIGEMYAEHALALWKYAIAAVVVLALSLGTVDFFSVKAYAQVSPSVELGVNRWNIVVATHALDPSGEEILGQSQLIGQKVDVAVERIVDQSLQNGDLEKKNLPGQFQVQAAAPGKEDEVFIQRVEENVKEGVKKSIDKKQLGFEKQSKFEKQSGKQFDSEKQSKFEKQFDSKKQSKFEKQFDSEKQSKIEKQNQGKDQRQEERRGQGRDRDNQDQG